MDLSQRRQTFLHRVALWCAALVLVITSLSAFIRLSQAGLGCEPWPYCYGQVLRATQTVDAPSMGDRAPVQVARLAHRVIATVVLLGVILMVVACFASRPLLAREGTLALAVLVLALGLAVLGRWTAGARVPAVAMGNLLGGVLMFALCCKLAAPPAPTGARNAPALRGWAAAGAALLLCQLALGALTSASYAGLSCSGVIDCLQSAAAGGWQWQMLDPWRVPAFDAGPIPVNGGAALTQLVHRIGALLVLLALGPLAVLALRGARRRDGLVLLLLLALQLVVGVVMVASGLALPLALAHNVIAALMMAVVFRMI